MLVVLNGPPAVGKSTIARRYADDHPMTLCIDVDEVRDRLGAWRDQPQEAGVRARAIASAMAAEHLGAGYDVVIAQLYGYAEALDALRELAASAGATYVEIVLMTDVDTTLARFTDRGGARLTDLLDAPDGLSGIAALHARIVTLIERRPEMIVVRSVPDDVDRTYADVLEAITPEGWSTR